ncbi:MAG: hypothetical protein NZM65_04080, partial [Flavobacteriales bacterium]|nr:hypothetical protein [Flavobacteriales bacterium]MDW8409848.1 hypothetical protein [Flavobacteriales bacterium]
MILVEERGRNTDVIENALLDPLITSASNKLINNEIAKITSFSFIRKVVRNNLFFIRYFSYGRIKKKELSAREIPFEVVIDFSHPQMTGVEYKISIIDENYFNLSVDAKLAEIYDFTNNVANENKISYKFNGKFLFGEIIETENFKFHIAKKDNFSSNNLSENTFSFVIQNPDKAAASYVS